MYKIVLQDIKAAYHLREDEHFMTSAFILGSNLSISDQFTSRLDHCLKMKITAGHVSLNSPSISPQHLSKNIRR